MDKAADLLNVLQKVKWVLLRIQVTQAVYNDVIVHIGTVGVHFLQAVIVVNVIATLGIGRHLSIAHFSHSQF